MLSCKGELAAGILVWDTEKIMLSYTARYAVTALGKVLPKLFNVFLTVHPSMILVNNQLDAQFFVYVYFYSLHVSGSLVPIIRGIIVSMRHLVYVIPCRWSSGMQTCFCNCNKISQAARSGMWTLFERYDRLIHAEKWVSVNSSFFGTTEKSIPSQQEVFWWKCALTYVFKK